MFSAPERAQRAEASKTSAVSTTKQPTRNTTNLALDVTTTLLPAANLTTHDKLYQENKSFPSPPPPPPRRENKHKKSN